MCGIVGFITSESKHGEAHRAAFVSQGLIVDTLRGDDSSGAYGVWHSQPKDRDGPFWCKQVAGGYEFVNDDAFIDNFYDVSAYRAVVGHNRAATVGKVDVDGAHPFVVGPITLVHNGTLQRTSNLPTPMSALEDVTVDSHAIAANLAEHSVEDVVASLDGAFTLIWHDSRDDSLNVIRNSKRPLHLCAGSKQDTVFFASEGPMLDFLCKRIGIDVGPIYYPKEGQHLKWLPNTPLQAPCVKELDLYTYAYCGYSGYSGQSAYSSTYSTGYYDKAKGLWIEYDSQDDDWRDTGGKGASCSGNVIALPAPDNRVRVGGRRKDIPALLQEELVEHNWLVEDRLNFTPKVDCVNDPLEGTMRVYGTLYNGMQAMIYSTTVGNRNHLTRTWTVRPVAVYVKPSGEPLLIVKLVTVYGRAVEERKTYEIDEMGEEMRWFGINGIRVGRMEFAEQVAGGCSCCGKDILPEDHLEIAWTDKWQPICQECDDVMDSMYEEVNSDEETD